MSFIASFSRREVMVGLLAAFGGCSGNTETQVKNTTDNTSITVSKQTTSHHKNTKVTDLAIYNRTGRIINVDILITDSNKTVFKKELVLQPFLKDGYSSTFQNPIPDGFSIKVIVSSGELSKEIEFYERNDNGGLSIEIFGDHIDVATYRGH